MADESTLAALLKSSGGIGSDARMPVASVSFDPAMERQIVARTSRGLDPTPDQVAYLKAIMPEKERMGDKWANVGHELTMIPQAMRAGSAIGEAYQDPSLANVTNAGMQTAFTALRPQAAAVIGGAGYAGALAKDLGFFSGSPAEAQAKKQQTPKQLLPGLDAAQQAALDAAEKRLLAEDYDGPAGRKQLVEHGERHSFHLCRLPEGEEQTEAGSRERRRIDQAGRIQSSRGGIRRQPSTKEWRATRASTKPRPLCRWWRRQVFPWALPAGSRRSASHRRVARRRCLRYSSRGSNFFAAAHFWRDVIRDHSASGGHWQTDDCGDPSLSRSCAAALRACQSTVGPPVLGIRTSRGHQTTPRLPLGHRYSTASPCRRQVRRQAKI